MKTLTVLLLGLLVAAQSHAITRTWTAGGNANWSDPDNWSPSGPPQSGDDLVFPFRFCQFPDKTCTEHNNDLNNLVVGRITFTGFHTINGNTFTVTNGIYAQQGVDCFDNSPMIINCGLILPAGRIDIKASPDNDLRINGPVRLNDTDLWLDTSTTLRSCISVDAVHGKIRLLGVISGFGDITRTVGFYDEVVEIGGSEPNTFWGIVRNNGNGYLNPLRLSKENGDALNHTLIIGRDAQVELKRDGQLDLPCTVYIEPGGRLFFEGHNSTFSFLEMHGGRVDTGGGIFGLLHDIKVVTAEEVAEFWGRMDISGSTHDFVIDGPYSFDVNGVLIGGGNGFNKLGSGHLRLLGANSFSGDFSVMEGIVTALNPTAFGSTVGRTILGNAHIWVEGVAIPAEPLLVTGVGELLSSGNSSWAGPITINDELMVNAANMTLSGQISGPGGMLLRGQSITFAGSAANTFAGNILVNCALFNLAKSPNTPAFSGSILVGATGLGALPLSEVRWFNDRQLPAGVRVTMRDNALLSLNDFTDTIANLSFAGGHVNLAADSALTITGTIGSGNNTTTAIIDGATGLGGLYLAGQRTFNIEEGTALGPDLRIDARIASGGINKIGPGTLALGGNSFFGGAVLISNGIVRVDHNNALGSAAAGTTVYPGATLAIANAPDLVREPVTLNGTGFRGTNGALTASGAVVLSNNVVLASPSTIRVDSPSQFKIDGIISGAGPLTKTGSGTLTLAGTANNTFSGDTLVNAGTLQLDKSDFVQAVPGNLVIGISGFFPTPATVRHFSQDQIWANVTVNGGSLLDLNGYEEYLLTLTLNGGGDVQTGAGLLTVDAGNSITVNPGLGSATSTISGRLGLRLGNHNISVGSFLLALVTGPELDIPAQVTFYNGIANIHKNGSGQMRLSGVNTFTGVLYVNDGRVTAANNSALGTTQGSTVVQTNGMLAVDGGITTGDFLILDTAAPIALSSMSGSNTVNNGMNLIRPVNAIEVQPASGYLQVLGRVGSVGGLTKLGPGTLQFRGTTSNDYAGLTIVSSGTIEAARPNRITIPGNALIGDDSTNATVAAIRSLPPGRQFRPDADVTVLRSGAFELGAGLPGSQETLNTIQGAGKINLGLASSLNISNDISFDLAARISGSGALNKYRTNTSLHIIGDSTFTGPTTIFQGDCRVDGNMQSSSVTIKRDAALRGDGWVGDVVVESGGIVNPNSEVAGHHGATLQMTSVNFLAGGILGLAFYGPHATGGNDSLLVNNSVTLNNTRFSGGFQYAPTEGDVITLISKTALGPISGIFGSWPEGTTRLLGEIPVTISYLGGNGNDTSFTVTNLALRAAGFRIEGGNGDGFVDRNECNLLWLAIQSRRNTPLNITHAELRSLTGAGMITIAQAAYPSVPPLGTVTNLTPFQLSTTDALNCIGEDTWVELQVTVAGEGTFAVPFILPTGDCSKPGGGGCDSCTIVAGHFTTNALQTIRAPDPVGAPSECLPTKPCPGAIQFNEGIRYSAHAFTNTTSSDACITAQLRHDCQAAPAGALIVAAYLDSFQQHAGCANYIGDPGVPLTNGYAPFSFSVPAGARFEVVVMQYLDTPSCPDYTITLFGLPCPRPTLLIAHDITPDNVLLQWSTAYPGWHLQSVNAIGGAFQNLPATPLAVVNSHYTVTNTAPGQKQFYRLAQ